MARKKVPTNASEAAATYLEDDEQLVEEVTTTKKIGRQRRKPETEEPISAEPVFENESDEEEIVDDVPAFGADSIAAVLFETEGQPYDNQFCTIKIRRNPDSIGDNFLNPCASQTNLLPMRNVELTADRMDIEDRVRKEYGGGHYDFQIYYNGALRSGWKATLGDDPAATAAAKAAKQPPMAESGPTLTPTPADPLDSMLSNLAKMRSLKDALFGDEQARLEKQIEDLKREIESKPAEPAEPKSETLQILERALASNNPTLQDKLLDYAFPADSGGSSHWIPDLVKTLFEHKSEVGGLLQMVFGGVAQPQPSIEQLMRAAPPLPPADAEKQSTFRRQRTKPATTEEAETDAK